MSGVYVLGRLIWRPAALLMLWALAMAALGSTWHLAHGPVDLLYDALAGFQGSLDVRHATWRLATLVPAVTGVMLSFIGREVQHSLYGWTLPGLSRGLRNGKIAAGVLLAALIGALIARISGGELASAAFGWAMLCFALGGMAFDPVLSKVESRGVPAILALLVFRPVYLDQAAALQPLTFGALSAIGAVFLLRREYSTGISRLRPLAGPSSMWATGGPSGTQQYWLRSSVPEREWNVALDTGGLSDWLRAGYYETYGRARRGWAGVALLQISMAMVLAYFTDNPQMVVVMTWVMVGTSMTQLRAKFLYPISRARRATLFVASTVAETLAVSALALAAVLLLVAVGPRTADPPETSPLELASFFVFFIAWAPLGHWAKIREPWTGDGSMSARRAARFFGFQIAYMIVAMTSVARFQRFAGAPMSWIAVAAIAIGIYVIYWLAVKRYYQTRDLVFART